MLSGNQECGATGSVRDSVCAGPRHGLTCPQACSRQGWCPHPGTVLTPGTASTPGDGIHGRVGPHHPIASRKGRWVKPLGGVVGSLRVLLSFRVFAFRFRKKILRQRRRLSGLLRGTRGEGRTWPQAGAAGTAFSGRASTSAVCERLPRLLRLWPRPQFPPFPTPTPRPPLRLSPLAAAGSPASRTSPEAPTTGGHELESSGVGGKFFLRSCPNSVFLPYTENKKINTASQRLMKVPAEHGRHLETVN